MNSNFPANENMVARLRQVRDAINLDIVNMSKEEVLAYYQKKIEEAKQLNLQVVEAEA